MRGKSIIQSQFIRNTNIFLKETARINGFSLTEKPDSCESGSFTQRSDTSGNCIENIDNSDKDYDALEKERPKPHPCESGPSRKPKNTDFMEDNLKLSDDLNFINTLEKNKKNNYGNVYSVEKEKPGSENPGNPREPKNTESPDKEPILPDSLNYRNTLRENMRPGHLKLPHHLTDSRKWNLLTPNQKHIFITICKHCVFGDGYIYDFFGIKIPLRPGEWIGGTRQLVEFCGPKITRNMVRGALITFKKYGWIDLDVIKKNGNSIELLSNYSNMTTQTTTQTYEQQTTQTYDPKKPRSGSKSKTFITVLVSDIFRQRTITGYDDLKYRVMNSKPPKEKDFTPPKRPPNIKEEETKNTSSSLNTNIIAKLRDCGNVHNSESKQASKLLNKLFYDSQRRTFPNLTQQHIQDWEVLFPKVNVRAEISIFAEKISQEPMNSSGARYELRILSWLNKAKPIGSMIEPISYESKEPEMIDIEKNKDLAFERTQNIKLHRGAAIEVLNEYVEFNNGRLCECLNYEDPKFSYRLNGLIRKYCRTITDAV